MYKNDMSLLSIGGFLHDGNITVSNGDKVEFSIQTERLNRRKHSGIGTFQDLVRDITQCGLEKVLHSSDPVIWVDRFLYESGEKGREIRKYLECSQKRIIPIDHHTAHMASAYFSSTFKDATILSLDGKGDYASGKIGYGKGNKIEEILSIPMGYSIGRLWNACNTVVGFPGFQYSGKTMALAGLGQPIYVERLLDHIELRPGGYYYFHRKTKIDSKENQEFFIDKGNIIDLLCSVIQMPIRSPSELLRKVDYDIAASIQWITNHISEHMIRNGISITGSRNVCIAGGVGLNGIMNTHLLKLDCTDNIFIQPAASDSGLSLGGMQYYLHHILGIPKPTEIFSPYLGRDINESEIFSELSLFKDKVNFYISRELEREVAVLLNEGKIVGWVQGREELGPRALGNRSILASPVSGDMKNIINSRIKHREGFRPFAPAVLEEAAIDFFPSGVKSPYMLLIDTVTAKALALTPAIVHTDDTARVQTVNAEFNPKFHKLLLEFYTLSGVPMLINTSLNDNEEPIVGNVYDTMNFFLRNDIDCIVIGDWIISKK